MTRFATHAKPSQDAVVVNAALYLAKVLHDSINALSFADEVRQVAKLTLQFVEKVSYPDYETQLNFFAEARASFPNFDGVLTHILHVLAARASRKRAAIPRARASLVPAPHARAPS